MTLALVVLALAPLSACDADHRPPSAPTHLASPEHTATPTAFVPTPEPTPGPMNLNNIGVRPPVPVSDALSEEPFDPLQYTFVVDLASGLVQPVDINDESSDQGRISGENPIVWLDDDTLWLGHPSSPVEMDLDGTVRPVSASPPESTPVAGTSPSGDWGVVQLSSGNGGAVFQRPPLGAFLYRVANAQMGRWSPTRDVHALAGSSCASWDLFLFDPNGGSGKTLGTTRTPLRAAP